MLYIYQHLPAAALSQSQRKYPLAPLIITPPTTNKAFATSIITTATTTTTVTQQQMLQAQPQLSPLFSNASGSPNSPISSNNYVRTTKTSRLRAAALGECKMK